MVNVEWKNVLKPLSLRDLKTVLNIINGLKFDLEDLSIFCGFKLLIEASFGMASQNIIKLGLEKCYEAALDAFISKHPLLKKGKSHFDELALTVSGATMSINGVTLSKEEGTLSGDNQNYVLNNKKILENLVRIMMGLKSGKAILLEGPPGVGKTSLVMHMAKLLGKRVYRVNLNEQTDLLDLLGYDVPDPDNPGTYSFTSITIYYYFIMIITLTSYGYFTLYLVYSVISLQFNIIQNIILTLIGCFRWFSGVLCRALEEGDWLILDELNLASQTVLEGLNSILDHREEVFISELGKTIKKVDGFQIFGCQNAKGQGNKGRKGLPLSFLNRFIRIYLSNIKTTDMREILVQLLQKFIKDLLVESDHQVQETLANKYFQFIDIILNQIQLKRVPVYLFNIRFFLRCNKLFEMFWKLNYSNESEINLESFINLIIWSIYRCLVEPLIASDYEFANKEIYAHLSEAFAKTNKTYIMRNDNTLSCSDVDGNELRLASLAVSAIVVANELEMSSRIPNLFWFSSLVSVPDLPILSIQSLFVYVNIKLN